MSIGEFQELFLYAITTGVFLGVIVGGMLHFFGRKVGKL